MELSTCGSEKTRTVFVATWRERERKKKAKNPCNLKTRLAQIKILVYTKTPSTAKDNKEKMRVGAASRVDLVSSDGE
jgi:hypothetical protein